MDLLRALFKTFLTILATLVLYSCFAIGYFFLKLFGKETGRWRNLWLRQWGTWICRILSIKVHMEGKPPEPPFFLVSNHLSYVDIMVYFKLLDTSFVAKSEIKQWPVIGYMAKTLEVIFIDRTRRSDVTRVNHEVARQIDDHKGVVLFPEGTTSSGDDILPFKASILEHPASGNMPVHYACISYETGPSDQPARESVCWWGDSPFGAHFLNFAKNRSVDAHVCFGETCISNSDRKELALDLYEKVSLLQKKMDQVDKVNQKVVEE
ncbi:lysophospholipid acyltransferase family protein [Rhodohalobacter halophilus]|uniref:lysophospholipid acyltransferase family protein n=1 Tax=Rhodohalobacter halophilus TaxID=1812810 RepID=UPI00083FC943|nr:lysophospholipid acyltransferase family protein [Rhodohalobacter halophilus]